MLRYSVSGFLLILFSCLLGFGCKEESRHILPDVPVQTQVLINNSQYPDFKNPGGVAFAQGGLMGIVVYHFTGNQFYAYEMACTFEKVEQGCKLEQEGALMECPCCHSQFSLLDGSVIKDSGPATWPMKPYKTIVNSLYVQVVN